MMAFEGVRDFRGMQPPDPLVETLQVVDAWTQVGQSLTAVYDRNPYLLFPELDNRGLCYRIDIRQDGVYVNIRK